MENMFLESDIIIYACYLASIVAFIGISVFLTKYIREHYVVTVNCWFCNSNIRVPFLKRKEWTCPTCEQFNGFKEDGDYTKVIREQFDESLNCHKVPYQGYKKIEQINRNGLCRLCNANQELKIKQLSLYVPLKEECYNDEIEQFKKKLEESYKLCPHCEIILQNTLMAKSSLSDVTSVPLRRSDTFADRGSKRTRLFDIFKAAKDYGYKLMKMFAPVGTFSVVAYMAGQYWNDSIQNHIDEYLFNFTSQKESIQNILMTSISDTFEHATEFTKEYMDFNIAYALLSVLEVAFLCRVVYKFKKKVAAILILASLAVIFPVFLNPSFTCKMVLICASALYLILHRLRYEQILFQHGRSSFGEMRESVSPRPQIEDTNTAHFDVNQNSSGIDKRQNFTRREYSLRSNISVCNKFDNMNLGSPSSKNSTLRKRYSPNYVTSRINKPILSPPKLKIGNTSPTSGTNYFSSSSSILKQSFSDTSDDSDCISQVRTPTAIANFPYTPFIQTPMYMRYPHSFPPAVSANCYTLATTAPYFNQSYGFSRSVLNQSQSELIVQPTLIYSIFHTIICSVSFFVLGYCIKELNKN